jgi:hypothetical protein
MYYFFDKDISVESVNEVISILQNYEKISLHFSTNGGSPSAMQLLIEFLNNKETEITLVDSLMSAGTLLFTDFTGKIKISEGLDFVMFHMFDRESYSLRKGFVNEKKITKQDYESNVNFAKKLKKKGLLTEKQVKQFLKGKDVFAYKDTINKWKL